jgi:predicted MFS family arabinose efflux permease
MQPHGIESMAQSQQCAGRDDACLTRCENQKSFPLNRETSFVLTQSLVLLFAVACGLSVANVYCAQPLLDAIARDFGVSQASVGLVLTVTQAGYALGLFFIVPLGDLLDRRRLVVGQLLISVLALITVGLSPNIAVMLCGVFVIGLLAVVIQVLVALAATLARPEERGGMVGRVTSGVVIGILMARTVAGALTDIGGWRLVYLASASLLLMMAVALWKALPPGGNPDAPPSYAQLLSSVFTVWAQEPVLRVRAGLALLIFGVFNVLWTPLVLPLSSPPISLSHTAIGLFGLVGAAGAMAAARAGRLADRGLAQWTTGIALVLLLASWPAISLLHRSLVALVAGIAVLDLAVQAVHVTNQSIIFARLPEARSRIVASYMAFYSIGSGTGAIASTWAYAHAGWSGVSFLGASLSATALVFWASTRHLTREASESPSVINHFEGESL